MKFCANCGAANEPESTVCYACGSELEAEAKPEKRAFHGISKTPVIIAGIVAAVVLAVGGILWGISKLENKEQTAVQRTFSELIGEETRFHRFFSDVNRLLDQGEFSLEAAFSGGARDWNVEIDYARPANQLQGNVDVDGFTLDFSANKDVVQLQFPGEYEVYGFRVQDVNKVTEKINNLLTLPLVGKLLPSPLPTDLKLNLFEKKNLSDILDDIAGEEYRTFRKHMETEEWNGETINRGDRVENCRVYKVSWKSEDLTSLLGALGSGGFLPNFSGLINLLLPEMDPYLFCYVNQEGYFVGARFTVAAEKCMFLLEGNEDLWENFSVTVDTLSDGVKVYRGGRTWQGERMELSLADEKGQTQLRVCYDDANGAFSLSTASLGDVLSGQVVCEEDTAFLGLLWTVHGSDAQSVALTIGKLSGQPEQLGEKYSDLMSRTWHILENWIGDWLTN